MTWIIALLLGWLLFNWLATYSLLLKAERMSVGRIPRDILDKANAYHVQYYVSDLIRRGALTTWLGWKYAVIIDRMYMRNATPAQFRFVLAHELGHCALGHMRARWLCTVSGLALIPAVQRYLKRKEDEADAFAEKLSGLPREILRNPRLGMAANDQ
jgi:Zn-dependent protease with chaperone function